MIKDLLDNKKYFKLVCGAGNEDIIEVEKLVALYSKAGCNVFDLSANLEVIDSAKRGLERAGIKNDRYLCCSVGIKGDPHVSKAHINKENCINCQKCSKICPQEAIDEEQNINPKRCIGCGKCIKNCPKNCIEAINKDINLKEVLPPLIRKGIDCIELHTIGDDEEEIDEKWQIINENFDGILSVCVDRFKTGNEKLIFRVKRMIKHRAPYTTILQADGCPMSGCKDDFKTTLQTVAMAEIFQNENLPVYITLSGGTNSKSTELAKLCKIDVNGIAIGSYARKIVKEYIKCDDFFENEEIFKQALKTAKNLVDTSMRYLND